MWEAEAGGVLRYSMRQGRVRKPVQMRKIVSRNVSGSGLVGVGWAGWTYRCDRKLK